MKTHSPRNPSPATGRPPEASATPVAQAAHGLNNSLTVSVGPVWREQRLRFHRERSEAGNEARRLATVVRDSNDADEK